MLISVTDLWPKSQHARVKFFDCRYQLSDPHAGFSLYQQGHIDGAIYADLKTHLSGLATGRNGRHPLPDPDAFIGWLARNGVTPQDTLVAYDSHDGLYASRLWWMWKWVGLNGHLLDGGYRQWVAQNAPVSTHVPQPTASELSLSANRDAWLALDEVTAAIRRGNRLLLDARAPERYRGDVEPYDAQPGHIPTAINHVYTQHLDAEGRFLPKEHLQTQLNQLLQGRSAREFIASCGSGVTACHVLFVLQYAGFEGAQLYPGSFSEWSADPQRPVIRGAEPGFW